MKSKKIIALVVLVFATILTVVFLNTDQPSLKKETNKEKKKTSGEQLKATVLSVFDKNIMLLDQDNHIYEFTSFGDDIVSGDHLLIEYTGLIEKSRYVQTAKVIGYEKVNGERDKNGIPLEFKDNGIFSNFYVAAYKKLEKLSLDEKIGQLLLVRYPDNNAVDLVKQYKFGGYVFFAKDFRDKNKSQVQSMMNDVQDASSIPLLTAVDEEGGTVVRVSSNPKLASEPFKSPQTLYQEGGLEKIKSDTEKKSDLLQSLGLNLNLAPVVDVSTDSNDYMYNRTIGQNTEITSNYAKTVIQSSKGKNVSYTLKHFPGYGNNADTHTGSSVDNRSYDDILNNDIPPFQAGIKEGAEAVLVSHNTVTNIDSTNPASLSPSIHNLLRSDLSFTGVTITDDISMGALDSIDHPTLKAILAGNDLIITTDYESSFNELKNAINDGTIDESIIERSVFRILAWKYYKGLMIMK